MDNTVETALLEPNPEQNFFCRRLLDEIKMIARISLPSMVFRVTSFGVFVVTQSFIGHIDALYLAAYALVQSISLRFINGVVIGMSSATETLCGQAFGARQYHMMGIYLQRSWIVNFVTVCIMLPVMIFASPIYKLLGEEDDISDAAGTISLWFIPVFYTFVFSFTMQMFLQAQMKNIIIMYLSSVLFVFHIIISWLLVDKLNLGIPGAMGAMLISQWGLVAGEFTYVFGGWCKDTWKGFTRLAFADLLPVVKLSISSGFMLCLELWYTSVLVLIAGYSSDAVVEVSAFSICLNLNAWEFMIALGLLTGACVRVSNELGRGNIEAIKFSIKILLCMSAVLGIFFCLIIVIFGKTFPYWFTSDDEVAKAAADLSPLLSLTMLISSFQAVFSGVAVGSGSQIKVAIINVVAYYVIGVPLGCVLAFVVDLGVKGIWIGMLIGMVSQVIALVVLTWRINWEVEIGMSSATETLCGQAFGARQYHMMGIYLQRSWIVNFVTVCIVLPVMIFASPIYKLLGEEDAISDAAGTISLWFIPVFYTFVFSFTMQMFLQAQMKNIIIMYLSSVLFVFHIIISWLFVDKLNLGIPGAMGAMLISQWGLVAGEFTYVFGGWCKDTWKGFTRLAFADLVPVVKLSISSGFMLCLELWYTSVLVLIAGYSSDAVVEVSAFSICMNLNAWEFMIALGLLTGACVRVSNELGRGNIEAIKFSIKILLCMSTVLGIFFCLIIVIFGKTFPYWFTSDDEVAKAAADLSPLLSLTMLISSFQAVFSGVAIGSESQIKVAIINVVAYYVIGVPLGCLLAFVADLGVKGIWIGMLIGMVSQVIALVVLTWRINWEDEVSKTKGRLGRFYHKSSDEASQSSDPA